MIKYDVGDFLIENERQKIHEMAVTLSGRAFPSRIGRCNPVWTCVSGRWWNYEVWYKEMI